MPLETQRCGNCEFYLPKCRWCGNRGAGHINCRTPEGKPTHYYPCNSQVLNAEDGTDCLEHSCKTVGRWLTTP